MIKLWINKLSYREAATFETTIFSDKTSQCWKISPEPTAGDLFFVEWKFENEAEIFHLAQLGALIAKLTKMNPILEVTTMPFARQDKIIANDATFALDTLMKVLKPFYQCIDTVDVHSLSWTKANSGAFFTINNIIPNERIRIVLKESDTDLVCYPDKGAAQRGYSYDEEYYGSPIILDKDRDQLTGEIKGIKFATKFKPDLTGYNVTIVDDLCDGGKTFIESAKLLKSQGAKAVSLYTTHGIYSKGKEILFANGIDRVFNYKEEIKRDL